MKQFTLSIIALSLCICCFAQDYMVQDSTAKVILDRTSKKLGNFSTIVADFELVIHDRAENTTSKNSGKIKIKGEKYYMESPGNQVHFDGTTMWSYVTDINEVTIVEPEEGESDFIENPALIFTFYNRDFKYRLTGEVKVDDNWMYEIDLFPKILDQPYSRIKLFINKKSNMLYMVKTVGKDGIDYTIYIQDPKFNTLLDDSLFTFKPSDYKDIEVVDMRF